MSDFTRVKGAVQPRDFVSSSVLPVFVISLFLSATLLFSVQPMFSKMILPKLGGTPSVWAVAMCVFQAILLAGYAYAHALARWLKPAHMAIVHLGVLLAAFIVLPIIIPEGWNRPPPGGETLWLLGVFIVAVGLPFFALAGNAPLLQAWFARTGHPHAKDPYFLYGASNLGSLLVLLAYPIIIEPLLTLYEQSAYWTGTFAVLTVLVGVSALVVLKLGARSLPGKVEEQSVENAAPVTWAARLSWIGLALIPSGLLVAVTTHITTDVAAAPFLWVLPLALFLLTFVITFQRKPVIPHRFMLVLQPVMTIILLGTFKLTGISLPISLSITLFSFFVIAMVCHGELVRRRPAASHLTEFYLWMSFGGMLGGLFTGLIAPQIFSTVVEFPLLIVLALFVRPGIFQPERNWRKDGAFIAILVVTIGLGAILAKAVLSQEVFNWVYLGALAWCGVTLLIELKNPLRFAVIAGVAVMILELFAPSNVMHVTRSFFGIHKVEVTKDGRHRLLMHGTTLHGAERIDTSVGKNGAMPEPLTYYHRQGLFADVIEAVRNRTTLDRVAAVGLGTGSLSCYRKDAEAWRYFEIDPEVVKIASDPKYFNFLSRCAPNADIVLGDARLTLTEGKEAPYRLIILDAFSSDAIPVHLLTLEAIRGYLSKLAPDGVLMFHISNRHMDLEPVLSVAARELGLAGLRGHWEGDENDRKALKTPTIAVALARDKAYLGNLADSKNWRDIEASQVRPWTDDYSDIVGAILNMYRRYRS